MNKTPAKAHVAPKINSVACPIFREMTLDEREQLLLLLEYETYRKGDVILREGNSNQILWILVHGKCEVFKTAKNGAARQLAMLEPGAVFGEMSFFEKAPHSASVRALTEVQVMSLSREKYDQLRDTGSLAACKIASSVNAVLAQRLRRMDEWTCGLLEKPEAAGHREEWGEFRAKLYSDWQF